MSTEPAPAAAAGRDRPRAPAAKPVSRPPFNRRLTSSTPHATPTKVAAAMTSDSATDSSVAASALNSSERVGAATTTSAPLAVGPRLIEGAVDFLCRPGSGGERGGEGPAGVENRPAIPLSYSSDVPVDGALLAGTDRGLGLPPYADGVLQPCAQRGLGLTPYADGVLSLPYSGGVLSSHTDRGLGLPPYADGVLQPCAERGLGFTPYADGVLSPNMDRGLGLPPYADAAAVPPSLTYVGGKPTGYADRYGECYAACARQGAPPVGPARSTSPPVKDTSARPPARRTAGRAKRPAVATRAGKTVGKASITGRRPVAVAVATQTADADTDVETKLRDLQRAVGQLKVERPDEGPLLPPGGLPMELEIAVLPLHSENVQLRR